MATVTKPIALDESFNTTELTPRNIADVLAEGFSHITGRNASQVEYDNTESGLTADNVQDALDEIVEDIPTVPSVDIQTAVDEFSTYNGGILDSLKVALEPIQDLHGYSEPWVGGAGKNKCDNSAFEVGSFNESKPVGSTYSSMKTSVSSRGRSTDIVDAGNVQMTISCSSDYKIYLALFDSDGLYTGNYETWANSHTITTPYVAILFRRNDNGNIQASDFENVHIQLELGSTATAYEPYENICPISGHTQVEVQNHQKNLIDWKVNTTSSPWNGIFESGNYVISAKSTLADGNWYFRFTDANGEYSYTKEECGLGSFTKASSGWVYGGSTYQAIPFTVPNGCTLIEIGKMNADGTIPAQVEEGSTATAYVPYNGYQVTVNLGGTYYSGTLDVVTGVFTPDTASDVFDGSENWTIYPSDTSAFFFVTVSSMTSTSWSYVLSEVFKDVYKETDARNNDCSIWSRYQQIHIHAPSSIVPSGVSNEGLAEFKAWLSNNPQKVVYKLATPTPIQLSPTMVKALVGENHLSAPLEGQEITESKYKQMFTFDDVIAYIQSLS